jgi:hypothetical protein
VLVLLCCVGGLGSEEWEWHQYWFFWVGEWDGVYVRGWECWGCWWSGEHGWGAWEYVAWLPGPPFAPRGGG